MTLFRLKHTVVVLAAILTLCCASLTVFAQDDTAGSLTIGQPVISDVASDSSRLYSYTLDEAAIVTFQVISETVQPAITITRDGQVVASEPNVEGKLINSFKTFLPAGDYTLALSSTDDKSGTVVLVFESAVPIQATDLVPGAEVTGQVFQDVPVTLYRLTALDEPSLLFISSALQTSGSEITLFNETANRMSGTLSSELIGGMFRIPANGASYRIEIAYSTVTPTDVFTICWVAESSGACGGEVISAPEPIASPTIVTAACTLTPPNGAVNVRSSASTQAPVIAPLKVGQIANVVGTSPDGFFYNIQLDSINGWVSKSVVLASGDCGSVATVNPPSFTPIATQTPTQPPMPTATPTTPATQPPAPTNTPSGPCLLTLNSPVRVYSEPIEKVDFLFDQVQGGELIPVGRLADGSWWKTNYANSWVPTYLFGSAITQSGNCSLPVVTP